LGQHRLAEIVLKHLLRVAGAEVRWGHRVTAVRPQDDSVDITIEAEGGQKQIRASWLVGADGASSGVRQALGLTFDGVTWPEWFVATNVIYDFERYGYGRANFVVDPVHWAIIPKISEDGLWRLTYGEPGSLDRADLRTRLADKLAVLLPGGESVEPVAFSPYRVHNRCADTFRVGRVLLAGDAAHVNNPIGGLGLTNGILDAVALGNARVAAIKGTAGEEILDLYAEDRRRIFLEIVSPVSSENKRRLAEGDPERRRADLARLERLSAEPALARDALLSTYQLVGTPILAEDKVLAM
jgi:2-polyprenyl-6-methoxyphenol hydroxylase-like FAD-dependent oxidoreductase